MNLTVHPEILKLKEELSDLIFEHESLINQICPNIEREYVLRFGIWEYELYKYELEIKKLKRKIQLIRIEINHENDVDLGEIEQKLEKEFGEYEEQLKVQLDEINYLESTKSEQLSDDDAKKLKELYRNLIKKLHPDLNPNQSVHDKTLFIKATAAFQHGNIADLEALLAIKSDEEIEEISQSEKLEMLIGDFKQRISKIKNEYPYNKKELLEDSNASKEYKEMLIDLIKDRKEYIDNIKNKINDMI